MCMCNPDRNSMEFSGRFMKGLDENCYGSLFWWICDFSNRKSTEMERIWLDFLILYYFPIALCDQNILYLSCMVLMEVQPELLIYTTFLCKDIYLTDRVRSLLLNFFLFGESALNSEHKSKRSEWFPSVSFYKTNSVCINLSFSMKYSCFDHSFMGLITVISILL